MTEIPTHTTATSKPPAANGPATPMPELGDARIELAERYLHGDGLEIGALHLPTPLPPSSQARYVDRMSVEDLRAHYPELAKLDLTPVDVIDDGERLDTIETESVDFIVANHFLEHCQDPIATIQTHLSKLRPGGTLFYAVPDKRYTFDFRRPRTPLQHLIDDHENGPERSRAQHYLEWVRTGLVPDFRPQTEQEILDKAAELEHNDYSIHFHVWTQADLTKLMFQIQERSGDVEVEEVRRHAHENIVVLRRHGDPPVGAAVEGSAPPSESTTAGLSSPSPAASVSATTAPHSDGLPLAGLRISLDEGSAAANWLIDPDGIEGRAWLIAEGAPVTVPLTLDCPVTLEGRIRLLPHDWRDGTGRLRVWVAMVDRRSSRDELWSHELAQPDDPSGVIVRCEIPAHTTALVIGADVAGPRTEQAIARFAFVEPYLTGAGALIRHASPPPSAPRPSSGPVISILCPVHDPPLAMLIEAIDSVVGQTHRGWELILSDDGSKDPQIVAELQRRAGADARIKLTRREEAAGIAAATNAALELATGEYIALLDHDDTLDPDALAWFAAAINADPSLDMLYSDEDIVLDGTPVWIHRKPAWSPDTLNTNGYTCHLGVYRRALVDEIGGFRSQFNGSQDVDMILRLTERTDRVGHVPEILYHWRIHPNSTAGGDAKPYAYVAARNAISEHLKRVGTEATVDFGPPGLYRVVHRVNPVSTVTIVVAVDNPNGLCEAANSWRRQSHTAWTAAIAAPAEQLEAIRRELSEGGLDQSQFTLIAAEMRANRSGALQQATAAAAADYLLLLEAPMAGISHDWLTRLIGYSDQPRIAAAGPIVLGPDGRVAYGGVAIPDGLPLPLLHGTRTSVDDHFGYGTSVYNVSAVDGALITATATFERLGGLDREAGALALIDYCLRAGRQLGMRSVTIGDARLQTVTDQDRGNDLPLLRWFADRWGSSGDPYYNRSLRTDRGDFEASRR